MTTSDADHNKAAEPLPALEWLRVTHADTLSGRRIEEAIAAERAAAVADLRARVEALVEELATLPGLREREYVAARLHAIADDQPVQP